MSRRQDVVIAGAGIIGCAIARELALRGIATTVLEGEATGTATPAAGGMLAPLAEAEQPGPFLQLALASASRYAAFVASLREETGEDVGFERGGKLQVAQAERDAEALAAHFEWQRAAGHDTEWLDAATLHSREPDIARDATAAIFHPEECRVDARRLARALRMAAAAAGAKFRSGTALAVLQEAGHATGLALDDGDAIEAGTVIIAAGAWSGQIRGPRDLQLRPVRGQMLALDAPHFQPPHVIQSAHCYLVPRRGRIIVGSTMEDAGFNAATTESGVAGLRAAAARIVPALARVAIAESWAGLRPATPDGLPVLGAEPEVPRLFYATGHFRNGILLAPITGYVIAALVAGESPGMDLQAFSASRFPLAAHG